MIANKRTAIAGTMTAATARENHETEMIQRVACFVPGQGLVEGSKLIYPYLIFSAVDLFPWLETLASF